jgi:phospholipid/cholesterol/gamma-HCH transport system permease protein
MEPGILPADAGAAVGAQVPATPSFTAAALSDKIARISMPPTTQQTATTIFYRNLRWLKFVDRLGKQGAGILEYLGGLGTLLSQTVRAAFTRPFYGSEVIAQMDELGVKSLSITGITAFSVGMVLALQTAYALAAFGGKMFIGQVVAVSLVRELGPVLTSLMVGGRVGSGITAELGSMTVTEQVDALRSMAISPVRRLVLPRVLAVVIMLPILTAIADVLGILGGLFIAVVDLQLTPSDYLNSIWNHLAIQDITSGIAKTVFFGLEVALIGCYNGLQVSGGASSVGQATTRTVVLASISILVSDFFLTKLFLSI